jgi:hypothetical protein
MSVSWRATACALCALLLFTTHASAGMFVINV